MTDSAKTLAMMSDSGTNDKQQQEMTVATNNSSNN